METLDRFLNEAIRDAILTNMLNLYKERYQVGENIVVNEYNIDDINSLVLLDVITSFGSPGGENEFTKRMKEHRKNQIKKIKTKKIKENDPLTNDFCPICIETFCCGEYKRTLNCEHTFHKKCIDRWFKKDKDDCPMCRNKIL
jgi:hypothetical protein